jgi:hypothetical protein
MWSYDMSYGYNPDYNRNNYVSTDPGYDPYSSSMGSDASGGYGNIWGSLISGVGQYASARSAANAQAEMDKMSAQAKIELTKQQRQYEKDDQQYRKEAVGKWSKYFG